MGKRSELEAAEPPEQCGLPLVVARAASGGGAAWERNHQVVTPGGDQPLAKAPPHAGTGGQIGVWELAPQAPAEPPAGGHCRRRRQLF